MSDLDTLTEFIVKLQAASAAYVSVAAGYKATAETLIRDAFPMASSKAVVARQPARPRRKLSPGAGMAHVRAFFVQRNNAPATIAEIAKGVGVKKTAIRNYVHVDAAVEFVKIPHPSGRFTAPNSWRLATPDDKQKETAT